MTKTKKSVSGAKAAPTKKQQAQEPAVQKSASGRTMGKSSNANYTSQFLIIEKDTKEQVQIRLLQMKRETGTKLDMSDLVNSLLRTWLSTKQ